MAQTWEVLFKQRNEILMRPTCQAHSVYIRHYFMSCQHFLVGPGRSHAVGFYGDAVEIRSRNVQKCTKVTSCTYFLSDMAAL